MTEKDRKVARMKLDAELRPFRKASRVKSPTNELLRAVRQVLRVPMEEIAERLGVCRSAVFEMERRERRKTITLKSLGRVAEALGCKVVYGVVPAHGKTLERLAEERMWREVMREQGTGVRGQGSENREQGSGIRDQRSGNRERGELSAISYQLSVPSTKYQAPRVQG